MYDFYYSTLRSYISMQPVRTDKPVARAPLTRPQRQQLNNNNNIFQPWLKPMQMYKIISLLGLKLS